MGSWVFSLDEKRKAGILASGPVILGMVAGDSDIMPCKIF
jgi:hypothetical protein